MANALYRASDLTPTTIKASAAFPSTYSTGTTDWIEVRGWTHVDFVLTIASWASVVDLDAVFEMASAGSQADASQMRVERGWVTGATFTGLHQPYEVDANAAFSAQDLSYCITVPVRGRWMRMQFKTPSAVGTDTVTVYASRRTS
jgi:hypothetical protein